MPPKNAVYGLILSHVGISLVNAIVPVLGGNFIICDPLFPAL